MKYKGMNINMKTVEETLKSEIHLPTPKMTYAEIKEAFENPDLTNEELETLQVALEDLMYDANEEGEGELLPYVEDVEIYGEIIRKIPRSSEPSVLCRSIRDRKN